MQYAYMSTPPCLDLLVTFMSKEMLLYARLCVVFGRGGWSMLVSGRPTNPKDLSESVMLFGLIDCKQKPSETA